MITLIDDGTLDTILKCTDCGEEFRFNFSPEDDVLLIKTGDQSPYDQFVEECKQEVIDEHDCYPIEMEAVELEDLEVEDEDDTDEEDLDDPDDFNDDDDDYNGN